MGATREGVRRIVPLNVARFPIKLAVVPTVLREKGYRFFFYMADRYEPPHIHVAKHDSTAKFWLDPLELAFNDSFREHELSEIRRIIQSHMDDLRSAWYKSFGQKGAK
jgi:hypothetical protein